MLIQRQIEVYFLAVFTFLKCYHALLQNRYFIVISQYKDRQLSEKKLFEFNLKDIKLRVRSEFQFKLLNLHVYFYYSRNKYKSGAE